MSIETRIFKLWDFEEKKAIEVSFKKAGDHRWKALCCFHTERHESLYYYDLTESYYCFGCGRHGISYEKYLRYTEALKPYNLVESLGEPVASYPYRDEEGKLLYQKYRFEKRNEKGELEKTYRIWRPDSKGGIIRNIQGVRRVIYNLDKINNSGDKIIFLLEGEKDCDNLMTRFEGILATTSDIGAGRGFKKWRPEYYDFFQDRSIIIIPDNDKISRMFYRDIGNSLAGIAKSVKWVILPGLEEHGDITDWLIQGGTLEELFKLIEKAPEFPLPIPIEERTEFTLEDLEKEKPSPEKLLMGRGIMPIKGYMLLSAGEKAGKTLFVLNMALCLISGNYFLDIPVMKKCRVFYIYSESSPSLLDDTITKIKKGFAKNGIEIDQAYKKNIKFYDAIENKLVFSLKKEDIPELRKSIENFEPDVIIIDPISRIIDFSLNPAENIVILINLIKSIRNCFWVIVHHDRKRASEDIEKMTDPISKIRGSSNLSNLADSIVCIASAGNKMPNNFKLIHFSLRRYYDPIPLQVKWDRDNLNYDLMDTTDFKRPKKVSIGDLITFVNQGFSGVGYKRDIVIAGAQEFKVSEQYLYRLMIEAFDEGKLIKTGDKWEVKEKQVDLFNNK